MREMRIAFTFPSVSQLDAKHQGNDEVRPRISRIERIKTRDMSNKKSHQGYVFVRRERTLSPTRSDSQSVGHGLPGALSLVDGSKMTRRWFEDGSKESRYIHGGNTEGPRSAMRVLRYAAILLLTMFLGMNTAWGGSSYSNCTESVQI